MTEQTDSDHESNELTQENKILRKMNESLEKNNQKQSEEIKKLEEDVDDSNHNTAELKQANLFFSQINQGLENTNSEKETKLRRLVNQSKILQQVKEIMINTYDDETKKIMSTSKKFYLTIALSAVLVTAIIIPYSLYTMTLIGQEYQVEDLGSIKSSYVIQNLKGDKIDTWLSWRLTDTTLYVNILNANEYPEKAEIVKDAILSTEFYEIDDNLLGKAPKGTISKYYLGWTGALEAASQESTQFQIPNNIVISEDPNGAGDITLTLSNSISGDGFSGITKTIADQSQNQILKSDITIYDVENLSKNQLTAITRHEFGHALGLAHSTAEEDLMHPELKTAYPYISHCNINAIADLYDGSQKSEVVCEK